MNNLLFCLIPVAVAWFAGSILFNAFAQIGGVL